MREKKTSRSQQPIPEETDQVARQVVDAAFCVHSALGPSLIESVYETCLVHELAGRGIEVKRQVAVPVIYEGVRLNAGLRLDLVVGDRVVVVVKATETVLPVHIAQVLTYLKLSGYRLGLLVNFNVPVIKDGIRRIVL